MPVRLVSCLWVLLALFRRQKNENNLKSQKIWWIKDEEVNEFKRKAIKLIDLGGLVERGEGVHIFYYVATSLRQRMNMMRTQRI
jgi:hypothetical protein